MEQSPQSVTVKTAEESTEKRAQDDHAQQQASCGGYECDFVEEPPREILQVECPICLLVLREPWQVSCCSKIFCASCIEQAERCPVCSEKTFTKFHDKRLKLTLYGFRVFCSHKTEGCEWTGELRDLDKHLNVNPHPDALLEGCHFTAVECNHCSLSFSRRSLLVHQSDDCVKRPHTCQHCGFAATFEEIVHKHMKECVSFPLPCPNKCEKVVQRQEVEHHVRQSCPLTPVYCEFQSVGCMIQLRRKEIPAHMNENVSKHMSLLQSHVATHPQENPAMHMSLLAESVQSLVVSFAQLQEEMTSSASKRQLENDKNRKDTASSIDTLRNELAVIKKSISNLQKPGQLFVTGSKCEGPPGTGAQRQIIRSILEQKFNNEKPQRLVGAIWMNTWKKFVGYDEEGVSDAGNASYYPGPLDSSDLFDPDKSWRNDLEEDVHYYILPCPAVEKFVNWYGKLPSYSYFDSVPLKLCLSSDKSNFRIKHFCSSHRVANVEQEIRKIFGVPEEKTCQVRNPYPYGVNGKCGYMPYFSSSNSHSLSSVYFPPKTTVVLQVQ